MASVTSLDAFLFTADSTALSNLLESLRNSSACARTGDRLKCSLMPSAFSCISSRSLTRCSA